MERPSWAPDGIDLARPSVARVYDFYLGGSHNFAVDRELARQAVEAWPDLPLIMQSNRAFLRRAVRHLVDQGFTQFLDIGSGIPTVGSTHEVVRHAGSDATVVYVDIDPVAVAHGRAILGDDPRAAMVGGDLLRPDDLLTDPAVRALIDPTKPLAVLLVAVLHFVADEDDPAAVLHAYARNMVPGSAVVVSHATTDGRPQLAAEHENIYRARRAPMHMRDHASILGLLGDFTVEEPGLVFLPLWRPDPGEPVPENPERMSGYAALGTKA